MNSNFGEVTVECEEGHIWTHKPPGGGYFKLTELVRMLKNLMNPDVVCDECGRPFLKVILGRHLNGK